MTDVARLIADMVREGVDPEMIGRVAQAMADLSAAPVKKAREQNAARQARHRNASNVTNVSETDPLPKVSEVPHTPPNLPNPSPPKTPLKGVKKVPAVVPENWEVSEEGLEYATDKGMDLNTVVEEQNRFRDTSRSKDTRYVDFEAAWRNWVRNWQKWRADAQPPPHGQARQQPLFRS